MNVYAWFPYKMYYARIFDLFSDMSDVFFHALNLLWLHQTWSRS